MTYNPCEKCKSALNVKVCSKFCAAYKRAFDRDVQRQLDEALFKRLARISK